MCLLSDPERFEFNLHINKLLLTVRPIGRGMDRLSFEKSDAFDSECANGSATELYKTETSRVLWECLINQPLRKKKNVSDCLFKEKEEQRKKSSKLVFNIS